MPSSISSAAWPRTTIDLRADARFADRVEDVLEIGRPSRRASAFGEPNRLDAPRREDDGGGLVTPLAAPTGALAAESAASGVPRPFGGARPSAGPTRRSARRRSRP